VDDFPAFSLDAACYLRMNFPKLKAVAIDVISVESSIEGPKNKFPVHRTFLDSLEGKNPRTLLLYEDVNLKKLATIKTLFGRFMLSRYDGRAQKLPGEHGCGKLIWRD
jgi:kynurenine formamidase